MRYLIAMYIAMQSRMQAMLKDEKGAVMIEYALVATLIGLGVIAAAQGLSGGIGEQFGAIVEKLTEISP